MSAITDIVIADRFKWTLDYVEQLPLEQYEKVVAVISGFNQADEEQAKRRR